MMKFQYLRRTSHSRAATTRRAAVLAGLATLIGVPLLGALPATAAVGTAPTVVITPDPTASALPPVGSVDSPWIDQLHYTFDIQEDTPFFVFAYNPSEMERITSAELSDGVFRDPNDSWDGLYLKPVDPSAVDTGLTTWELRGTLSSAQERMVTLRFSTGTELGGDTSTWVSKQVTVRRTGDQYLTRPEVTTIQYGRDLKSVEIEFDVDLLDEDLEWNNNTYAAAPLPGRYKLSSFTAGDIAFTSMEISGKTLIARFTDALVSGVDYTLAAGEESYGQVRYGPMSLGLLSPDSFTGQQITAPSTTPPALDTDTPPVVAAAGTSLTLTFDYPITAATPDASTLTVTAGGSAVAVSSIANSGATSVLTLASAIAQGATVKVSYDAPTSGGYQDAAGNLVADFTDVAATNNSTATVTTTTTAPATTTTAPATVSTTPSLVTEANQGALTAAAGSVKLIVNGEEVEMTLSSTGANDAGATAPENRTAAQITELQDAADGIVERLDTAAGGDSGLTVVDTDTGAEIDGIFEDTRVPVEDVIVAEADEFSGLYASRDEDGNPNKIRAEVLEMERGGEVAVYVYGLPAGESAELVLMSTPYLLGTATADSNGNFTKVLSPPEAILAGTHTLVTASETLSVSLGIKITEPAADVTLPATGGGDMSTTPVLLVVLVGAFFIVLARRRQHLEN